MGKTRKIDSILLGIERLDMSVSNVSPMEVINVVTTCLPDLQLYNRKVSSSDAVRTWSPLSSKVMEVICRGPALGLKLLPADDGGVGSTAFLNTLAGFNLFWGASTVTH